MNGMRNTTPIKRAHNLWNHSQKKINLKSVSEKWVLRYLYWAICWYLVKAFRQSCSFKGGIAPIIGFHSVIERPEPVNRVIPPSSTCTTSIKIPTRIQFETI